MMALRPYLIVAGLVVGLCLCAVRKGATEEGAILNPMRAVDKASLTSFVERPLFDPMRRLPSPVPPAAEVQPVSAAVVPPEPPPSLRLVGVIHGPRDIAILQRNGETKTTILHTGDHIGNWIAKVVPPVGVRLTSGNRAFAYALFGKDGLGRPLTADVGPAR